jgi:EAL domain-containing protein (putative c-di-GMP-specific phosphodiesterase class I)
LDADANTAKIVHAILTLARGRGKDVTAEGVEGLQQLSLLREMDCPFAQGYLVAKPLAFAGLRAHLFRCSGSA